MVQRTGVVNLDASDLRFILQQIKISENHAAGNPLLGPGPNQVTSPLLPHGLRTVNGDFNNLITGQETFGAADIFMPRLTPRFLQPGENLTFDPDGPGGVSIGAPTSYTQNKGVVEDSRPRVISNLIVDQTGTNPAAAVPAGPEAVPDPDTGTLPIPNVAPDVGLSAPFNSWFTFFGRWSCSSAAIAGGWIAERFGPVAVFGACALLALTWLGAAAGMRPVNRIGGESFTMHTVKER